MCPAIHTSLINFQVAVSCSILADQHQTSDFSYPQCTLSDYVGLVLFIPQ